MYSFNGKTFRSLLIPAYFLLVQTVSAAVPSCPTDTSMFGAKCYQIGNTEVEYNDAIKACNSTYPGVPAVVDSEEVYTFIKTIATQYATKNLFIGLTDEVNGHYIWADGTELTWSSWANDQPGGKHLQACVVMVMRENWKWHDKECNHQHGYVCEYSQVNGTWNQWGAWSVCSVTCGIGRRERQRVCRYPYPELKGWDCIGDNVETNNCSAEYCPVNGSWSDWSQWGACSVTCGSGQRTRERHCSNPAPQFGGLDCDGHVNDKGRCFIGNCPVNGSWSDWSQWGACSVTCGTGRRIRERNCSNPSPKFGGLDCQGINTEVDECFARNCSVNGTWSEWSHWGGCSVTCGSGQRVRARNCSNPASQFGGLDCIGSDRDVQYCLSGSCPVNGSWSDWSKWSACSVTCGSGQRVRERNCSNPAPQFGGLDCIGYNDEVDKCVEKKCPVNGSWSNWSNWNACSATCGSGQRVRERNCSNPAPQFGGFDCAGFDRHVEECLTEACPVNGSWSNWSKWSACSVTCGSGQRVRVRNCSYHAPQFGGLDCIGYNDEVDKCVEQKCPVNGSWSDWSKWSACSATCGSGQRIRGRNCSNPAPQFGGLGCIGLDSDVQQCLRGSCPVDGSWSDWGPWGDCSVTCGQGQRERLRNCTTAKPFLGALNCAGNSTQTQACASPECIGIGVWGLWGTWSSCSSTCGVGSSVRKRCCLSALSNESALNISCQGDCCEVTVCSVPQRCQEFDEDIVESIPIVKAKPRLTRFDDRVSSTSIGISATFLLAGTFLVIIILDLRAIKLHLQAKFD